MALDKRNLIELAKTVAKANPSASVAYSFGDKQYSYSQLDSTLRKELNELVGTPSLWRQNKNIAFELIEEVLTEVTPKKILEAYGQFADIRTFNQGEKVIFRTKITEASKNRAKKFITKVGLAGVYEVFKLDGASMEIPTSAIGGAAQIGFEEYLDEDIEMSDVLDIALEGLNESIYREIAQALKSVVAKIQSANKVSTTGFDQAKMDELIAIADVYGHSTIYCTYEFASTMVPDSGWVSNEMKNAMWTQGYIASYKGHNVVILPQSFEDSKNQQKVMNPGLAFIIPTGAEKPVKVAFEGQAQTRELENRGDWSREIQFYQKVGVAVFGINNGICVYENTTLSAGFDATEGKVKSLNAAPGLDATYTAG